MTYLGADPGKSGGISWITPTGACVAKMPPTLADLWELISCDIQQGGAVEVTACLESVSSSPQMGVKSAFTFGNGFGHLEMALTAARIPFVRVRPQVWMKALGCMTKGDKNVSKARAQELFPHIKMTHAIADSILIAEYCRRTS